MTLQLNAFSAQPLAAAGVLVIHSDEGLRARVHKALSTRFEVMSISSLAELSARGTAPRLVMAESTGARRLLKTLERVAPDAVTVFLSRGDGPHMMTELVDLALEGHPFEIFEAVDDPEAIASFATRMLAPRNELRMQTAAELTATLSVDGREFALGCSDVSNAGVRLAVPASTAVEVFTPGRRIARLQLHRGGSTVLQWENAVVRHLHFCAEKSSYQVGIKFGPARSDRSHDTAAPPLTDPVRIAALLRRALRNRPLIEARYPQAPLPLGTLKSSLTAPGATTSRATLSCTSDHSLGVDAGDILEVGFELSGKNFTGLAAVLQTSLSGFTLALPRQLHQRHRRNHVRFEPPASHAVSLRFTSPLTSERLIRPVYDLELRGLAFEFDPGRDVFPPGLRLEDAELCLPDGTFAACTAAVRMTAPSGQREDGLWRCGVEVGGLCDDARKAILDAFVQHRMPEVRAAHAVPFRDIWELLNAAHLFHPDYPFEEGEHLRVLERTHSAVAALPEGVSRTFGWYEDGKLAGHASGLRTHSRTWMLQHLAVAPGFHRSSQLSRELSMLAVDFAEALDDIEWLRIYWRVQNRWPDRIFGWIARSMEIAGLTSLRFSQYTRLGAAQPFAVSGPILPVRRLEQAGLLELELELRRRGELVRLASDDLRAAAQFAELEARFRPAGLSRERVVFASDDPVGNRGYLVADAATRGLCWSELTNSFQLVLPQSPHRAQLAESLTAAAVDFYRIGQRGVLALVEPADATVLAAGGFTDHGRVAEWTFHRSLARNWHALMGTVFERLERRSARAEKADPTRPQVSAGGGDLAA